jgi:hypothetical protein
MKISNPMKWGFDPRNEKCCRVLKSEKGRIIWGSIRGRHIVDQYFDGNCLKLLKLINDKPPKDVDMLWSQANGCGLGVFGKVPSEHSNYNGLLNLTKPDMEFWGEMFDALTGKLKIEMEYPNIVNKE